MTTAEFLQALQKGALETEGVLPWSSNYTFLVRLCSEGEAGDSIEVSAVYKPRRGERPLWDFARGTLCQREAAAFIVSDALGWRLVPPTILRNGSHGIGSFQLFIEHDPERHYFTFEGEPLYREQLQKIVLFDLIINNADRKSGHVLLGQPAGADAPDRLWAIDHGVTFHTDHKLRTVIWEFVDQPIPQEMMADLVAFRDKLATNESAVRTQLEELLTQAEIFAIQKRLERLIRSGIFPKPGPGRHYPWPPV